ncbi:ATP-dependent DNA helicase PcrA [Candidatus Mycoplasma haematohominis]|uniref:DNA 3'-5' helicase n=1 Tax=Candidatus Mycoplasma haematohominis TaxID=1494318 RepID=A0A478FRH9_9MOLU|nr:ATP-dependent DNA helicase PcrA [Candidatus Mycoplasma haemohominis]
MSRKLNKEQLEAIKAPKKPILVIAGAGTGKTTVLISRVIELIETGIEPRKVLVITFTNKARDEIVGRIREEIGSEKVPSNIFTFHAFFHKLLKKDMEKVNPYLRDFKLLDESDQKGIIRRLIKELLIEDLETKIASTAISLLKINNYDLSDKGYLNQIVKTYKLDREDIETLYKKYIEELTVNKFLDYDDLEVYTLKALNIPEVRDYWKNWFNAVLIDEFQDTSTIQMEIIKKIVDKSNGNIFCVGDPDQSIYGFRGAKPKVCSEFLEYFDNSICIKLEENYRSTKNILQLANHIINKNQHELSKNLWTRNSEGNKIKCTKFRTDWDEIEWVLNEITTIRAINPNSSLRDFVILYRNNSIAKLFEIALKKKNIDYAVTNSVEFFSRIEIKFIVAFLRLLFFCDEPGSAIYIKPINDAVPMGIGDSSSSTFHNFLSENKYSFMQGIENIDKCTAINTKSKKAILRLGEIIEELKESRNKSLHLIIQEIIKKTNYEEYVINKKEEGRLENLRQFGTAISENLEGKTNREIVEEISLRAKEVKRNKTDDFLLLSTVHQAKGLEYKYVFLVKMSHTVFPSFLSKSPEDTEEERRLAYVAITRAKEKLYMSCSPVIIRSLDKPSTKESIFMDEAKELSNIVEFIDRSYSFAIYNKK